MEVLTLIELGSGRTVKCQGPHSFDLKFTRSKCTSPSICVVCHRALWFWEFAQNCAAPAIHSERAIERADYAAREWKLTRILTSAQRTANHCQWGLLPPLGGL
jgi:hypothetical protein